MLTKIKDAIGYALAFVVVGAYLLFMARKSGKESAEIEQAKDRIKKAKQANDVDKKIDNLDAGAKRDRLRKHSK